MDTVPLWEPLIWTTETWFPLMASGVVILVASTGQILCVLANPKGVEVGKSAIVANVIQYLVIPFVVVSLFWLAYGGFFIEYCKVLHFTVIGCWILFGLVVFPWFVLFRSHKLLFVEIFGVLAVHLIGILITSLYVYRASGDLEMYSGFSNDHRFPEVRIFYVDTDAHTLIERDKYGGDHFVYRFKSRPYGLSCRIKGTGVLIFSNRDESDSYLVENVSIPGIYGENEGSSGSHHGYSAVHYLRDPQPGQKFPSFLVSPLIQKSESEVFEVAGGYFYLRINTGLYVYDLERNRLFRIGTGLRLLCLLPRQREEKKLKEADREQLHLEQSVSQND